MSSNRKFVIMLEILVIAFLVMSVVPVCGLSDYSADISAYPSIVSPGDEITVTFSGAPGFELDWIAMYKVGDPNEEEYDMGYYLAGKKSGTLIFTAPDEPGDYEFRLFEDDGYTDIARSNIVTVQEGTSVSTPTPTPTPTTPTEGGPVGYWNLNEVSGNIAYDSSGSGNDGTIHGATWIDNGSCENALSFDGVDDYVETDPATFQSNDITVEAWIYPKSFSSYKTIIHKGDRIGANNLLFAFDLISNKISFYVSSNGNNYDSIVGTTSLELNKWYHVVGVYRSSDKFFAVYVNGTEDNTKTSTLSSLYHDASKYWIGARYDNRQFRSDRYFNGIIDEVRIYDRALSEEEIQVDMNECSPTSTIAPPKIPGKGDCKLDERPEFTFGNLETFDFDNDGSEDRIVYTFEPEEVAEDLFLVRSIEFDKTDSELFEGKIVLKFENKGETPIEYSHIEEIPKSFAESVDDLEFSVPPDEIIDPDPKVYWKGLGKKLQESEMKTIMVVVYSGNPILDCYPAMVTLHKSTVQYCVNKCNKLSATERDLCLLDLVNELSGDGTAWLCDESSKEILDTACNQMNLKQGDIIHDRGEEALYRACKAMVNDNITECNAAEDEFEKDLCKAYLIERKCKDIEDTAQREECILVRATGLKCLIACSLLTDEDQRNYCLARVEGNKKYCDKIKNEDLRKLCLGKIACPPCTGSGLKLNTSARTTGGMIFLGGSTGRLWIGSKTIDGDYKTCIYDGGTITWSDQAKDTLHDEGIICICESNSAKNEFQRLYSKHVNLPQGMTRGEGLMGVKDAYILSDIRDEELSLVVIDDTTAPEIINERIIGWYLYRERYLIGVAVTISDQEGHKFKSYDAIDSFIELEKCAKEVVDKREGIN